MARGITEFAEVELFVVRVVSSGMRCGAIARHCAFVAMIVSTGACAGESVKQTPQSPSRASASEGDLRPFFPFDTVRFVSLKERRPGPLPTEAVERYIKFVESLRRSVAAAFPRNERETRMVMIADSSTLAEYLLSNDETLAEEAAFEAAIRADPRLITALEESLRSIRPVTPDEIERPPVGNYPRQTIIVSAIGRIGTEEATRALKRLVTHEDVYVRLTASYLLSRDGLSDGKDALLEGVSLTGAGRIYHDVGIKFAKALLAIGFGRTPSELDELFDNLGSEARYLSPILAERGDEVALSYLRDQVVNRDRYHGVRKWAATALGHARDQKAIPYLKQALSDPVADVRKEAEKALVLLGENSAARSGAGRG